MKALLASVIALILCSGLVVTRSRSESEGLQKPVDNRLTAATTRFSFKLYKQVREPRSQNTFVSPASVMLALAMTYNGADGTTREAMAKTLEVDGMSLDEVNRAFADLRAALNPNDPKVQLTIANSLWVRNGFKMNPAFVERNKQHFGAEVTNLDFGTPAAADTINAWVKKNTGDKIEKIVDQIRDGEVLFLINAIYFKGQWKIEFKKENTKPDAFRLAGGEQKQLPMMSQSGNYFYYKGNNFQSIALPYGKGDVYMYVFLPDEQTGLDQFVQDLTPENWDRWMNSFSFVPGEIKLPRFKVEWEATLDEALKTLGMAEAFDGRANFSKITPVNSEKRLYITEVKHKSWCEVNEEGTVAAAATSVGMGIASAPPPPFSMKVNRPFFFAIRDRVSGVVLFMGSVTNPG